MTHNSEDEQQNSLLTSLRAMTAGQGGPLESALSEFLNGEGTLVEATRAASAEGGKEIAALVKILTSQFNLPPAMATLIATALIKLMPSIVKQEPKKRKKPSAKLKPKKKPAVKKKPAAKKPATKKTTERKKPAAKKPAAKKKPGSTTRKRKPAAKKTRAGTIEEIGETP